MTLPPTGDSIVSEDCSYLLSNPNNDTKDVAINECDAPVSINTFAQVLKMRNVPLTIDGPDICSEAVTAYTLPYDLCSLTSPL